MKKAKSFLKAVEIVIIIRESNFSMKSLTVMQWETEQIILISQGSFFFFHLDIRYSENTRLDANVFVCFNLSRRCSMLALLSKRFLTNRIGDFRVYLNQCPLRNPVLDCTMDITAPPNSLMQIFFVYTFKK